MLRSLRFMVLILVLSLCCPIFLRAAAENAASGSACADFEEAKAKYFNDNQYNEFIDFLNNYKDKDACVNYYKAFTRYAQLKYLEEKQSWDDYFANGNTYRGQIEEGTNKAISLVEPDNYLRPKSRLLLWQFHRDQQDAFAEQALADLITDSSVYAKGANDTALLKDIADSLLAYGEKSSARQIYKLYVDKLVSAQMDPAGLKSIAAGFYKESNLDLAESIFDVYMDKISGTLALEKLVPEYFEIASLFVYKPQGLYDMAYAEKIYERIEKLGQADAFRQETIYLRAFNLEKFKDYPAARELYLKLIQLYPDTKYFDEAVYKVAMINAYISADIGEARKSFEQLVAKAVFSPQVISSFYQLGLLAQWEGDLVKAQDYYNLLKKNATDSYTDMVTLANERIKEIEENKPLAYNLKTFLDLSLKNDGALVESGKSELKSSSYLLGKGQSCEVSSFVNMPQSGCNQVQIQYLWSGNLGGVVAAADAGVFKGVYADAGTKEVNIVIISPAGTVDRSFMMIDVY